MFLNAAPLLPPLKWLSETRTDGFREGAELVWLRTVVSAGYTLNEIRQAFEVQKNNGVRLSDDRWARFENQIKQLVKAIPEPPSGMILAPLDNNGLIDQNGILKSSDDKWVWIENKWLPSAPVLHEEKQQGRATASNTTLLIAAAAAYFLLG